MAETNTGMWLDRSLRTSDCGTWWSASTDKWPALGLLQLEAALMVPVAVQERVAATVSAVRAANPRGVLRTTELVVEARRAFLVVATRPTPTLEDVLASWPTLAPGAAAGIAVDIAATLRDLHAVGLSHGDLTADTVVLTPGGSAVLIEVGVLAAAQDRPTNVTVDVQNWSVLVRGLAVATGSTPEAELLAQAAAMAESGDLATAARRLAMHASELADFTDRESLVAALPSIPPAPPRIPAQRSNVDAVNPVRLRFGRGIPEAAIVAAASQPVRASLSQRVRQVFTSRSAPR